MKSLGKILGLVFLGLLLIVGAAGFALTHLFAPNDYKDEIRDLARSKAGLELDIKGDIGWSLFPWLGLELHETTLASAQTPEQPFADLPKHVDTHCRIFLSSPPNQSLGKNLQLQLLLIVRECIEQHVDEQSHGAPGRMGRRNQQPHAREHVLAGVE